MASRVWRSVAVLAALAAAAVAAPGGAPAASYAKGVDVSRWNGPIDWLQVVGDGYSFLFAKATESTTFVDVTYAVNRLGTQGVGLRLGAYHFARPAGASDAAAVASATAQADHFVDVAQPKAGDLPPVLDLEANGGLGRSRLARWAQAWLDEVLARTGVSGVVYASPAFWKSSLGDTTFFAGQGHKLWVAHWTTSGAPSVPAANWGGTGWTFWQWTDCARVPGVAHCSDGDRANGPSVLPFTLPVFPRGAPAASSPPTIVGAARVGARLAAVAGIWSGGKPVSFTYQWQRCGAAGGGCAPLPGATLDTYAPTAADLGRRIAVSVTATGDGGSATTASPPSLPVKPAASGTASSPVALTPPELSGAPQVGQRLRGTAGTWSGSPTSFAYRWRRCNTAGASCAAIAGATGPGYTATPGDLRATLSLVVTATGPGGAQSATAPTSAVVVAAPVPRAVAGSLVAQPGLAGAVVASDGRATVTWQPGAVPAGTTVSLRPTDGPPALPRTGLSLTLTPARRMLPWPLDVAYPAAPLQQIAGFSPAGPAWLPLGTLATPTLPAGLSQGVYADGSTLHVLTRQAGRIALFRRGGWGDPRRISPRPPVLRASTGAHVTRLGPDAVLLAARLSTTSQAQVKATALATRGARPTILAGSPLDVLAPGGFTMQLRVAGPGLGRGALVRVRLTARDPWGRSGALTLVGRAR
ncbi:MAG: lysozyme [Actinomycetota bacterium]